MKLSGDGTIHGSVDPQDLRTGLLVQAKLLPSVAPEVVGRSNDRGAGVLLACPITTHAGYPDLILGQSVMLRGSEERVEGTFAARDFKKGETIRLLGASERYDRPTIHQKITDGELNIDDPFQVGKNLYIILDEDSRRINHSCDPNAGIRGERKLIALRDIKAGEEITFDYSTTAHPSVEPEVWTMKCQCGSANCRGDVANISTVPPRQIAKYLKARAIPRYLVPIALKMLRSN